MYELAPYPRLLPFVNGNHLELGVWLRSHGWQGKVLETDFSVILLPAPLSPATSAWLKPKPCTLLLYASQWSSQEANKGNKRPGRSLHPSLANYQDFKFWASRSKGSLLHLLSSCKSGTSVHFSQGTDTETTSILLRWVSSLPPLNIIIGNPEMCLERFATLQVGHLHTVAYGMAHNLYRIFQLLWI